MNWTITRRNRMLIGGGILMTAIFGGKLLLPGMLPPGPAAGPAMDFGMFNCFDGIIGGFGLALMVWPFRDRDETASNQLLHRTGEA
jgi:hypothetical protein